ncbi:alpha/beta hydrolase [Comamonas piscis]|uniref:Alpha/beta hydrolase n=1 Tax=Comamonas piscis TaxID=1562974 RepID=A0A7G5EG31_9BURK|nr:alpha/beta hydrolase [Comamonas piscis]QMV72956.1 alpha/beta hydrolase [Comamonas piscis]WSO35737.1 alpha/beta hydrolase [Comamonas piscis]
MTDTPPIAQEHWISLPQQGRLYAKTWTPAAPQKAPLVLMHDSLGSVALWRDFPAQLAQATGRQVVAYDRLGFGQSDARTDSLSPQFVGEEAEIYFPVVREHLGLERFALLGHSVGGGMGIAIAAGAGQDCTALVTIAAQAFVEDRTWAGIVEARALFQDAAQLERLAKYHGSKARWVVDAWTETWLSPAFADWTVDAWLPRLQCPLLAIHGELDEYGSTAHPERIARQAGAGGQAEIIAGAHHMPHREMAEQVLGLVQAFLAQAD